MANSSKLYTVLTTNPKGHVKTITVRSGTKASVALTLHRFALVGKGDQIRLRASGNKRILVPSNDEREPDIPITPPFTTADHIHLGRTQIQLRIGELYTPTDLRALEFLEQFHYKTNKTLGEAAIPIRGKSETTSVGGRRSILFAALKLGEHWTPAGYIDLQMPLMMCKPRHRLFAHPFQHRGRSIAWKRWDTGAMRKYLNAIVRVARIVIAPEFRGLGITRRILVAAKEFSSARWHIGGMRPIFMEISAEMLSHIDFVSSSGFKFVGNTEGNTKRVLKDLQQMSRSSGGDFGIMSLQRKYLRVLSDFCATKNISLDQGLEWVRDKLESGETSSTVGEWAVLRSVIRTPIPYYLCPLDTSTDTYLREAQKAHPPDPAPLSHVATFSTRNIHINIENLTLRATYSVPETKSTKMIMNAFGLRGDTVSADIIHNLAITASNGNIILVVGASGSGKSLLLNALDPGMTLDGNLYVTPIRQRNYTAGRLRPLRDDMPLFEALAERYGPSRVFVALSLVGLSEALAFIKPFWMLSRGQQYRAMLADLLLRDEEVWLLDEFCSDLDPMTAQIVAHNLRKQVIATGRVAFVAAANHVHYVDALRPTRVLLLRPGDMPTWLHFREYRNEFLNQVS